MPERLILEGYEEAFEVFGLAQSTLLPGLKDSLGVSLEPDDYEVKYSVTKVTLFDMDITHWFELSHPLDCDELYDILDNGIQRRV